MAICYLGIGSNVGDRHKTIKLAVKEINDLKDTRVIRLSRAIETVPIGGPAGQPKFLNAALKIKTELSPLNLLKQLKRIENKLGRKKTVRFGPRAIDLDILFYGSKIINTKILKIPHSEVFKRKFVMKPLLEIL